MRTEITKMPEGLANTTPPDLPARPMARALPAQFQ